MKYLHVDMEVIYKKEAMQQSLFTCIDYRGAHLPSIAFYSVPFEGLEDC